MKKKIFLVVCLALGVLTSCARQVADPDTITVWHWMTDRDDALQELARRYTEQTNIKVVLELHAPSEIYSQKIIAAAQARVLPDVYGILDKKYVLATFIESGFVADLTAEFEKDNRAWQNDFFPKALVASEFEPDNIYKIPAGIYGVPIDVTNIQMLYNKDLLAKAGIVSLPATFAEFLSAIDALNRVGIAGLVSGWGEAWLVDCFAANYAFNIMGEDKVLATYKGQVPYTDPDWLKVFEVFATLRDRKAFIPGIVIKVNKDAEQDFALNRAAFAFNGSWCVNVYHKMNPDLHYGVMLPPKINPDILMKIWGGAGSSFVVNNASRSKDKAVAFLKWLTAEEQQTYLARMTKNLPANRLALRSIPPILAEFAASMEDTTHSTTWKYNEDALVAEAFAKGLQAIIIGEKTPGEVAALVQQVKERQLARQKR